MATRREFIAATGASSWKPATPAKPPNVIVLITDDQGYGDLSLHGNPILKTPNLDRIGTGGIQFTRFHVSPVCSPTRSSLMTGRYNYRTGVVDTYLGRSLMHADEVTLAECLASAGYRTGIFGKWHLGDNYPLRAMDQGFQEALTLRGGGLAQPSSPPGTGYFDPPLEHNGRPVKGRGYCTDIFFDAAMEFISANRESPFFTYLATNAPHDPLQVESKWVEPYRKAGLDDRTAKVYGMVANLDHNTGRLLDHLRRLDLERDTLLVFLGDNGPAFARYNAAMRGLKGTTYEGGLRVPCFMRWPAKWPAGATDARIAAHIDLLPTILDACAVRLPPGRTIDGRSLLRKPVQRNLFFQWHRGDAPEPMRNCAVLGPDGSWSAPPPAKRNSTTFTRTRRKRTTSPKTAPAPLLPCAGPTIAGSLMSPAITVTPLHASSSASLRRIRSYSQGRIGAGPPPPGMQPAWVTMRWMSGRAANTL